MTDLEMIKKCAKKMGYTWNEQHQKKGCSLWLDIETRHIIPTGDYDPLHDDAQAMALVKRFKLSIFADFKVTAGAFGGVYYGKSPAHGVEAKDLNRAIVECVAKLP